MTQTTQSSTFDRSTGFRASLDNFFAGIGQGFNAYMVQRSRLDQIEKLNAKTDAELGAMGLDRDGIVRHVFRDMLHL